MNKKLKNNNQKKKEKKKTENNKENVIEDFDIKDESIRAEFYLDAQDGNLVYDS